ncbi:PREDICTED: dnaJ homolog subfamily C member 30 [Nanorana parkeri]|uniref:dnaJ homolog subfamily C member 30 n=1 Tax=Nanorana parkeri TaxID=125878 RepID=UPI000854B53B|nr:PREDICTED: dnaJ homolog subfamily C member 30 [Nanorana parkeri]
MLLADRARPASTPVDMAEVRLRLLRRSAQLQLVEDVIPSVRAREAVLTPSCMTPVGCNRETAACASKDNHRKWTLWPSTLPRGQCMWVPGHMPLKATSGVRFYSQGHSPRASSHQTGSCRRVHNSGALEPDVPLYATRTGYYDILEVTGNATQSQIKTAYYKQSFRFHPDRNAGDVAATLRFGQVTEAYHVLGSTNLRKKYDRGILSPEDVRTATKPSGKSSSPSRKEATGQRQASGDSSTLAKPMFDFDAFYQAHYGEQLERERLWKQRREEIQKKKQEKNTAKELNMVVDVLPVLLLLPVLLMYLSFKG